jgi:ubiquinone/menaquinone biosynthesis C-methylase UbiE
VDLTEYRQVNYETWQRMAPGWERERDRLWQFTRQVSENMVARLDPQPGHVLLELACGTGETGFNTAPRLGEEGKLIATDFAPDMVEAARRRARELGLANVDVRVMDAEHMDLPDDSVDCVLCRFGYMLMPDAATALAETRRVLRDGGRLAFAVWAAAERNPWAAAAGAALVQLGHMPMPEPGAPGIFSMGTEERIRELVVGAGFGEPQVEEVPVEWRFESFEDYLRFLEDVTGVVAIVLAKLTGEQRAEVDDAIKRNAEPFRANGAYVMPGVALNALAS